MNRDNVGMIQFRNRLGLACEASFKVELSYRLSGQQFDGDEAIERFLPGLVHRPHSALTDQLDDFQLRKGCLNRFNARRQGSRW